MSRINFLPPWVETTLQPAFYDKESGTVLQQTARMYAKVNQLIRSVNDQNETIADYIQQFIDLREYVEDYFDNLDVQEEINQKLDQMVTSGQLQTLVDTYFTGITSMVNDQNQVIADFKTEVNSNVSAQDGKIQTLESRMDSFSNLEEGSTTGDAELIDGRVSFDGRTFTNIGDNIRNYQGMGYSDIKANATYHDGQYCGAGFTISSASGWECWEVQTKVGYTYLIDTYTTDTIRQVCLARNNTIPASASGGDINDKPIVIKGNGSIIRVNNKKTNSYVFIGESTDPANVNDTEKYFNDITATVTSVDNSYVGLTGNVSSNNDFKYCYFTPTVGKIYRIISTTSSNAPLVYQADGIVYPSTAGSFPVNTPAQFYDIYASNNNTMYVNTYKVSQGPTTVKVYESKMTYAKSETAIDIDATIGSFDKAVFCGDSLTKGYTYTAENTPYRNFYNYVHYTTEMLHINDVTSLAFGGATTTTWWSNYQNNITEDNALYFVWLGTNDTFTDTVATDCAGDDYTQYADTETGDFGKILGKISSRSNVRIVMLNCFKNNSRKTTNNKVINDLATKFNAVVINLDLDIVRQNDYHTVNEFVDATHFNSQGYNLIANQVQKQLNDYMNSHVGDFYIYKELI